MTDAWNVIAATGEPQDVPVDTIVEVLSASQRKCLLSMDGSTVSLTTREIPAAATTLHSLWDFGRSKRGCMAPIMLVTVERGDWDGKRYWYLTDLGKTIAAALRAHTSLAREPGEDRHG